jgi:hypothetical protein
MTSPPSYYVPTGNWTNNVVNSLGSSAIGELMFEVNVDHGDPAEGCQKEFTANYSCGNNTATKSIKINKEAYGQTAAFDCNTETSQCSNLKLVLTDDGKLSLTTLDGATKLWDSVSAFGAKGSIPPNTIIPVNSTGAIPNDAPLTVPSFAADGVIRNDDETTGRASPFNYLLSGQFLSVGQWIGSPSGTCRLMMGSPDSPHSLQVVKTVLNCNSLDATVASTGAGSGIIGSSTANPKIDPKAARLYTIPSIHSENIGKVGYVNNYGQLQLYPDTMTAYDETFHQTGNYRVAAGAELGPAFKTTDIDSCKTACLTGAGDTQKCAGFVFDSTAVMCQLLNKSMYTKNRIIDPNSRYFSREKNVDGQHGSCPTDINLQSGSFWNDYYTTGSEDMSPDTKCGLAKFTSNERDTVASDVPVVYDNLQYKDKDGNVQKNIKHRDLTGNVALLNKNKNGFRYMYETLQDKYQKLTSRLFNTNSSIKSKFAELEDSRKNLSDWTGEQLQNLEAMNEDRDLNMMSQNYRHIMWSILAILIIITTMKLTKSIISKGPASIVEGAKAL